MKETDSPLTRIIHQELMHGCTNPNLSLYHGKMGTCIFLYHCSRHLDNPLLMDFADEVLEEILTGMDEQMDCSFCNGLGGIAWGLEYLAMNRFIEISDNEIFSDIDRKLMAINLAYVEDVSLETGLSGIRAYIDLHTSNKREGEIGITQAYIHQLHTKCHPTTFSIEEIWNRILHSPPIKKHSWKEGMRMILEIQRMN